MWLNSLSIIAMQMSLLHLCLANYRTFLLVKSSLHVTDTNEIELKSNHLFQFRSVDKLLFFYFLARTCLSCFRNSKDSCTCGMMFDQGLLKNQLIIVYQQICLRNRLIQSHPTEIIGNRFKYDYVNLQVVYRYDSHVRSSVVNVYRQIQMNTTLLTREVWITGQLVVITVCNTLTDFLDYWQKSLTHYAELSPIC